MSDDYARLAPVYDRLGMADFAERMTPALIDYAQAHDWIGRRVVDLGCGTGTSVRWLANKGYNITGIDLSPAMLRLAQQSITNTGLSYQFYEGDVRALSNLHDIDLALALDVVNELNSLRDLETVFASVAHVLSDNRLFVFDLHTIEGLAHRDSETGVVVDEDTFTAFLTHRFDYDRQASMGEYILFQRQKAGWHRQHTRRVLRGFPIQVVTALLQRAGFGIMALLNVQLEGIDPASMREPRVIVFAQRSRPVTE